MKFFKLPDLGEGLTEAEIVQWHVHENAMVQAEQPLLSVETAKAIVEIPSPYAGRIRHLYGQAGDLIHTGDPLVEFSLETDQDSDAGTVVGQVRPLVDEASEPLNTAVGSAAPSYRVTPAVRALAQRLGVDLGIVTATGNDGMITANDIQRVSRLLAEAGPLQVLRGTRRAMARSMEKAHNEVVAVTVCDDADLAAWYRPSADVTVRLIQAIVAGCRAEPALNAWYDGQAVGIRLLQRIDLGVAVDTEEGLFVPVLRDVAGLTPERLRTELDRIKQSVRDRSISAAELRGYTFTLSNFGGIGGRYASPIVVPPTVAILGAGAVHNTLVLAHGEVEQHPLLPLSLSFDHRAVTGGEAARFLAAVVHALEAER